ncbi:MAG TPA: SHOCT domain-containing protein [Acidimicrobiales bacterium]|nr:SHOCT domain-containing protein [Acidimicrobiales bacterium]
MPGLLRGVARTAVVAGTATAVSGRVQRRQAEKYAARDANIYAQREQAYEQQYGQQQQYAPQYAQPYAPAPAPSPAAQPVGAAPVGDDTVAQLQQLTVMKSQGILTEEEFAAAKAKVLGS